MNEAAIIAISELLKLGFSVYVNLARQAGLNEQQIEDAFKVAKDGMLKRDPSTIPN